MEEMTNPASEAAGAGTRVAHQTAAPHPSRADAAQATSGAAYSPPVLERLGAWRALTLQQSVPIFP